MIRFATVLFLSALVPAVASAQPNHDRVVVGDFRDTITVSGHSTIMLEPDVVTFTIGVQTSADEVKTAVAENSRKTEDVIAALKAAGATAEELQTRNFSIWPEIHYDEKTHRQTIEGYRVSNEIVVRKKDPAGASRLLQAAVEAGANTSGGLNFIVSDPAAGDEKGLVAAYLNARTKAELLAQAAGRSLGKAISLTEGSSVSSPRPPMPYRMEAAAADSSSVPVEPGREQKHYVVTVVFSLD